MKRQIFFVTKLKIHKMMFWGLTSSLPTLTIPPLLPLGLLYKGRFEYKRTCLQGRCTHYLWSVAKTGNMPVSKNLNIPLSSLTFSHIFFEALMFLWSLSKALFTTRAYLIIVHCDLFAHIFSTEHVLVTINCSLYLIPQHFMGHTI